MTIPQSAVAPRLSPPSAGSPVAVPLGSDALSPERATRALSPRRRPGVLVVGRRPGEVTVRAPKGTFRVRGVAAGVLESCDGRTPVEAIRRGLERRVLAGHPGGDRVGGRPAGAALIDTGELLALILDVLASRGLVERVVVEGDDEARLEFLRRPERIAPHLPLVERVA